MKNPHDRIVDNNPANPLFMNKSRRDACHRPVSFRLFRCRAVPTEQTRYSSISFCRKTATQRIPRSIQKYVTGVSEESQRRGRKKRRVSRYSSISFCRKTATQRIPGSIQKYVTGVSEESQRRGRTKGAEYRQKRRVAQVSCLRSPSADGTRGGATPR